MDLRDGLAVMDRALGARGDLRLRATRVRGRRARVDRRGEATHERVDRWALTGTVTTRRKIEVPLAASSAGGADPSREIESYARTLRWVVESLERATATPAGSPSAVLGPQAASVLVHECLGHFAEADPGAPLSHRLGMEIASACIDVVDDPAAGGGRARFRADDEGVRRGRELRVVEGGILVRQLHSVETAEREGMEPTGNGRAACVWSKPMPRMSNLCCSAGSCSMEELIERVQDGVLVHRLAHGFSRGLDVGARVVLAERISGGRRTGTFWTGGIVRERVDVLTRVRALGRDREWNPNGLCGKRGQVLYGVGTLAPAMGLDGLCIA